jgi:O-acetylserine/cysteine efflux transporter
VVRIEGVRSRHVLLATLVAAFWGFNFVVIEIGLDNFPPLLFVALRFVVAAFPAVLFVRRPRVPWRWYLAIGLPMGVGQFGLLFIGMRMGMPAGLTSVVLQTQALFTILLAGLLLRERLNLRQALGVLLAFAGVTLIGIDFGQTSPIGAFMLCLGGAAMWGLSNVGMRRMNQTGMNQTGMNQVGGEAPDAFGFMVWMSLVPPVPLLALSLIFEGPRADLYALTHLSISGLLAVGYIAYFATLVGFGIWGWLMRRYDAGVVAMYSLLVPPFGLASAALVRSERFSALHLMATALIIGGVAIGNVRRSRAVPASEPEPVLSR